MSDLFNKLSMRRKGKDPFYIKLENTIENTDDSGYSK